MLVSDFSLNDLSKQAFVDEVECQHLLFAGFGCQFGQLCNGVLKPLTVTLGNLLRRLRIGRIGLSKLPSLQWHYLPAGTRF